MKIQIKEGHITTREAAEIAEVTRETIQNLCRANAITHVRTKRQWYVLKEDVEKYASEARQICKIEKSIFEYGLEQERLAKEKKEAIEKARVELMNIGATPERFRILYDMLGVLVESYRDYVSPALYGSAREVVLNGSFGMASIARNLTSGCISQHWQKFLRYVVCRNAEIESRDSRIYKLEQTVSELRYKLAEAEGRKLEDDKEHKYNELLDSHLIDYDLSVRCLNGLKSAEIETIRDLVRHHRYDLLKIYHFGKKSLTECDELLEQLGLSFGMEV